MDRMKAALLGAREVGFTVLSISVSLVAVFIPLLFMGGQVGRLFREFAVTLSAAVLISLVISLTTTPMMCAWLLQPGGHAPPAGSRALPSAATSGCSADLRTEPRLGAGEQGLGDADPGRGDRPQRLPVQRRAEGLLPAAGHRPAERRPARRPEHLVAGDGREAAPGRRHHPPRSGGGHGGRLHRRRARRRRLHVRQPEAGGRAHRQRPGRDRAAAPAARAGDRPAGVPEPGAGRARRRPAEQLDLPVHAEERQPRRPAHLGDAARRRDEAAPRADRRRHRPAGERRRDDGRGRPRQRLAARPDLGDDRRRALRRLRPAPGRDDLRRAEPVPRDHGMGAALHQGPNALADVYVPAKARRRRRRRHATGRPRRRDGSSTTARHRGTGDGATATAPSSGQPRR